MTTEPLYQITGTREADESQIVIDAEIPSAAAEKYKDRALARLGRNLSIDGFRPGKVPAEMIEKRVGDVALWQEIAGFAISDAYPMIVEEKNLRAVGQPSITITKLAPGNPIGFSMTIGLMPEVTLPDYAAIAKQALVESMEPAEVTDTELQDALRNVRENHAHAKWHQEHPEAHGHDHPEFTEEDLPVIDDAFAQSIGGFATVAEFEEALKKQLASGKAQRLKEKQRSAIAEALIAKTPFAVPPVFIESELNKMTAEFESTVGRMGMTVEDYLGKIEKDIATLRNEWRAEAKKRAQLQVILGAIAKDAKLEIDEKRAEREVSHILEHFPDARRENVRAYVETMLMNQKVFEFLEGDTPPAEESAPAA